MEKRIAGEIAQILAVYCAFWFCIQALFNDVILATVLPALACAGFFLLKKNLPHIREKARARRLERELPFALLSMSSEIGFNNDFLKVLENASRQDYGLFSKGLKEALARQRISGASVQETLCAFGKEFKSTQLKRAVSQLVAAFETGNRKAASENLKKLAQELLARQRIECKEYSARLSVMSLMFISASAVMPALFNAFVIVGGAFLEIEFSPMQVLLIGALAFPAIDIAILVFMLQSAPESLKAG